MTLTVSDVAAEAAVSTDVMVQMMGGILIDALKRVAPALSKDKTLPLLACVKIKAGAQYAVDNKWRRDLTFEATDRYVIARQTVTLDADQYDSLSSFPGEAGVVIDYASLPKLDARTMYELRLGEAGLTLLDMWKTISFTVPNAEGDYPNFDRIFTDSLEGTQLLPATLQLNPAKLAQLAKMAFGRREAVQLTYTSIERPHGKPLNVTIPGNDGFRGLVMPDRIA